MKIKQFNVGDKVRCVYKGTSFYNKIGIIYQIKNYESYFLYKVSFDERVGCFEQSSSLELISYSSFDTELICKKQQKNIK